MSRANSVGEFTPVLPGNELDLFDVENFDIVLSAPAALGLRFQDGVQVGCVGGGRHPDLVYPNCFLGGGVDSTFGFTFKSGATVVHTVTYNAPNDQRAFVGIVSPNPFDRVEVREVSGGIENDFSGAIFVTDAGSEGCGD